MPACIWRWVQAYAPELNKRCRPHLKPTNKSYRIDVRVVLRQCKYLNNMIEQDHRAVKKRVRLAKGYGSFQSAWRTLQGSIAKFIFESL
jgi:transposase-like protein